MELYPLPVQVTSVHMEYPRLDVYYPSITGVADPLVQRHINEMIYFQLGELIKDAGYFENPQVEITGKFEIKTNERNILSLSLINYWYAGGAHGTTIIKSQTFDVTTGKLYQLKELFKPEFDYVRILSEIVGAQIQERDIPLIGEYKGISPDQDFYIADKCLVLYFQLYVLTPYAYGFPYFPISVYEIQDIIDENGPLGKMIY